MEIEYVTPRTIFETIVGSRAYGIHHEGSDYDRAGVMIPGKKYFLAGKNLNNFKVLIQTILCMISEKLYL